LIAIIDDDEAVREALSELLEVTNIASRCFDHPDAFLEEEEASDFDCIITDMRMPGIDGIELQKRLRDRGSKVPVIFITSTNDPATRSRAVEGGAHAYLAKPVADEILLARVRSALDGKASSRIE
jgi:FixJ family two-component response regulator